MILTTNNDPTARLTSAHVRTLAECDDVTTYTECGWFCVLGYKDGRRVVHAHANSAEEFVASIAGQGLKWTGRSVAPMTPEERAEARDSYSRWGRPAGKARFA